MAVNEAKLVASRLGLAIVPVEVNGPDAFDAAFGVAVRQRAHALLTSGDPLTSRHQSRIIALCARHRLPAMYLYRDFVDAGGLMAYGPSVPAMYAQAAVFVDKILKGARAQELPVEQPTTFDFSLNLRTAKALGLVVPQSVYTRADHVVQ